MPSIPPESSDGPNPSGSHPTTPRKNPVPNATQAQSTPAVPKHSASRIFTTLHFERVVKMRKLGAEMQDKFVGPMPVQAFLDKFLPPAPEPFAWEEKSKDAFNNVTKQNSEVAMYNPFIKATEPFCPSLELIDTHSHPDPHSDKLKPDLAAYMKGCDRRSITDFAKMEIHLEFKFNDKDDAFRDWNKGDTHSFERDTEQGKDTKGQITSYATAHLASQFRSSVFSVLICGSGDQTRARLLRWDRSGAVVTEPFLLVSPQLAEFFWRYSHLSPEDRGVDVSVSPASDADAAAARRALRLPETEPMLQIRVADGDNDEKEATFIFGSPEVSFTSSLTGRSTRGFAAYEPAKKRVVYLKDTWRLDVESIEREGKIYQTLNEHEIPHVAQCLLSGDVRQHATRTQEFVSEPWACDTRAPRELVRLRHYRLVLNAVGSPLYTFESTRGLVVVVGDAFEAHKLAYEQAGILHRDISVGNILIDSCGRGLLIDWDLSKPRSGGGETARRQERTGTWQFMAARLLLAGRNDVIQHTLQDDMESFIHVIGWVALRFIPNDLLATDLSALLNKIFDYGYMKEIGRVQGGGPKRSALLDNEIPNLVAPHIPKFRLLLQELTEACSVRYMRTPTQDMIDEYEESLRVAQSTENERLIASMTRNPVAVYKRRMAHISDSEWMLRMLKDAVANSDGDQWPGQDRAAENPLMDLTGDPSETKRKSAADLVNDLLPNKRARHGDPEPGSEANLE